MASAVPPVVDWAILGFATAGGLAGGAVFLAGTLVLRSEGGSRLRVVTRLLAADAGHGPKPVEGRPSGPAAPPTRGGQWPSAAKWSSSSWATNLTALVTALAVVVAAFGDPLAAYVRAGSPEVFAVSSGLLLVLMAGAPMAYAVLGGSVDADNEPAGTDLGWRLAGALTVAASVGCLSALGRFVGDLSGLSSVAKAGLDLVLLAMVALLLGYGWKTYLLLSRAAVTGTLSGSDRGGLRTTGIVVGCCGSDGATRVWAALL